MRLNLPLLVCLTLAAAGPCAAGSLTPAGLNAGYGRQAGDENRAVAASTRDANGNRVIVNGLLADPSGLSGGLSGGLGDGGSSLGQISAQAVANQINVVAQGSWNTIVVNATQTNTGTVTATVATSAGSVTRESK